METVGPQMSASVMESVRCVQSNGMTCARAFSGIAGFAVTSPGAETLASDLCQRALRSGIVETLKG